MPDFDEMAKAWRRAAQEPNHQPTKCLPGNLSIDPVIDLLARQGVVFDDEIAAHCQVSGRSVIQRWRKTGLNLRSADRVALALGRHPFELWGRAYWGAK